MHIDKDEVLRYLGYKGGGIDSEIYDLIDRCSGDIMSLAVPRTVYKEFKVCDVLSILEGEDIKNHLAGCAKCVLMAATIGIEIEKFIRKTQVTDMAKAVVLDSCATAAVESLCDELEGEIASKYPYVTSRYSPGYGDMPIEVQRRFVMLLDTARKIGLTVTERDILLPRKSVTAVIGVSETEIKKVKRSCETCNLRETCGFRKEGKVCGK